jgi:valyl-tRNA synthetase
MRKAKSDAKVGMRAEVARVVLAGPQAWADRVRVAEPDLRAAGRVTGAIEYVAAGTPEVRDTELVAMARPTG